MSIELVCSGNLQRGKFKSYSSISYCAKPVTMNMTIMTGGKVYQHLFKDGEVVSMPVPIKVGLKPVKNEILVNVSHNIEL